MTCFDLGIFLSCTRSGDFSPSLGEARGDGSSVSFSTEERGETDGDADPSDNEVAADVSLAESSNSSSELVPLSSAASFLTFERPRRRPFGVSSESSDRDMPTTARVEDHVLLISSLFGTGIDGERPLGVSTSVVEI